MNREENFLVGQKVCKISGKPFKSRSKVNTVSGFSFSVQTGKPTLTFIEDDSEVEAFRCKIFIE